ncbi:MAG: thiolase family protein [Candidatus Thermoplasmatota archaeon]|nr:thiolase family protein [Candidatus Thermoplasmatota archaeon]MCL5955138.1 thiolase family protein [Candidatus Thermoplasmatota archaeon]
MSIPITNEAYIVDAIRTPVGRRYGALKEIHPVDLLGNLIKGELKRTKLDPSRVEDVIIGCVSQAGDQGFNVARNAWLSAGLPETVPGTSIDRQCGSSLQAVTFAAQAVKSGMQDLVFAGGVESMSRVPMGSTINSASNPITLGLVLRYGLDKEWFSQAKGAQLIAERYGFEREELDEFSYMSHVKAGSAMERLQAEIMPVEADINGDGTEVVTLLDRDEGIRLNPDLGKMKEIRPAFKELDLITAGNSSQISDGASISVIASQDAVEINDLKPRARVVAASVVGVDPVTMLTGPIPATEKVLQKAGLDYSDIDYFEVNEAFAPVVMAWQQETGVPWDKVNIHGGAIAIGHPLGATGTRILSGMLNILEQHDKKFGLIAICEGGGMANAMIIERI